MTKVDWIIRKVWKFGLDTAREGFRRPKSLHRKHERQLLQGLYLLKDYE